MQLTYSYNDFGQCSGVSASVGGTVDAGGNYSGGTLDYQNSYHYNANDQLSQIDRPAKRAATPWPQSSATSSTTSADNSSR